MEVQQRSEVKRKQKKPNRLRIRVRKEEKKKKKNVGHEPPMCLETMIGVSQRQHDVRKTVRRLTGISECVVSDTAETMKHDPQRSFAVIVGI